MRPMEAYSDGDWIILEEFVDDASARTRVEASVSPAMIADPILQRVAQLTHDMYAAKVEPKEIVRRVLEMVAPSLESRSRDEIRSVIENQIRSYHDSFTA